MELPPPTSIEQLPSTALVSILQHLPQHSWLGDSARVSTAWAAAAAEACTDVWLPWYQSCGDVAGAGMTERLAVFQAWLAKHGRHVQTAKLQLQGWQPPYYALRLPCSQLPQLRRLVVERAGLSLDSSPGLAVLPALRSLSLRECGMAADSLALLRSAPITYLHFDRVSLLEEATDQQQPQLSFWERRQQREAAAQRFGAAVASLLAHLPLLVELELSVKGIDLTSAATAQLSLLRKLHLPLVVSETGLREGDSRRVHAAALPNLRSLEGLRMFGIVVVGRVSGAGSCIGACAASSACAHACSGTRYRCCLSLQLPRLCDPIHTPRVGPSRPLPRLS
jgi:hypothetical protein